MALHTRFWNFIDSDKFSFEAIGFWLIIATLIMVAITVVLVISSIHNPCASSYSFECKNYQVQQCVASEQYTKDQCVTLVGGGK